MQAFCQVARRGARTGSDLGPVSRIMTATSVPALRLAKLTAPDSARACARSRLFERLDNARRGRITWISAPAGAGKTTLVASYLQARELRAVWYHMDAADGDPATFFFYLGLAVKAAAARNSDPLPPLTAEYLANLPVFARNCFRQVFAQIGPEPLLVFDDYHELAADSLLHAVFREGLGEVPPGQSVVVISRAGPPPALVRLRTLDAFTLLTWDDLRFTPEECAGVARSRLSAERASKVSLPALYERAQGWVAGAILLLEQAGDAPPHASSAGDPLVFDYFAGEVFAHTDARLQSFMLHTALLPNFTAPLAAAITETEDAEQVLVGIDRHNYFIIRRPRADGGYGYEYHPLFRKFLLEQGRRMLGADGLARLKRRAADLLAEQGEITASVALLREIADWEHLAALIMKQAPLLLSEGRYPTLADWLSTLPEQLRNANPWLVYFLGLCRVPFDLREARGHFERAFEGFACAGTAEGEFLAWAGIIDTFVYAWSDFKPADRWIAEFEKLRARHAQFPSHEIEVRAVAGIFSILMYRQPQHPDLPCWATRLEELLLQDVDPVLRMMAASHLVLYHNWWTGRMAKVAELVNHLEAFADAGTVAPLARIVWQGIRAISHWMSAENEACIEAANRGLALGDQTGVHVWDFSLLAQAAFAALTSGDLAQLRELLKRMQELPTAPDRHLDKAQYHYIRFMEAASLKDVGAMRLHAEACLRHSQAGGVIWVEGLARVVVARARFADGDRDNARRELDIGRRVGLEIACSNIMYEVHEAETELALAEGDEPGLLAAVRALFGVMREQGFVNSAWWRGPEMARLCAIALEHDIERDFVRSLVRLRRLRPDGSTARLEAWPWPIRIFTLGRFRLEIDDEPLQFSGKVQKKPLELLKALIAFGGRGVNESRLAEALWPDAEGDAAHNAFVTTLQRLRKLVDNKTALIYQEGRVSLDADQCWTDVWALDSLPESGAAEADLVRLAQLYRGAFLAQDVDAAWAIPARERLRRRFAHATCELTRLHEASGRWDEAATCCERALEIDDTVEEFYQRLMSCHAHRGRHSDLLATYRRCRDTLASKLQIRPSARTEGLFAALHAKNS